ncbi:MAG: tRNA (N(6)-L-threonylcarbamoyladenosine(37)-C(2))-methylthiotransferase MtaB [Clostridia bacterium]|nr:tRNA (N(6)-L-threonylcarbamoyladenosine(37)-C(2))-methylthiotransferase MtaB [Clostridia bacterium]
MRTIAVHTLGCKVNQYDSEAMLECFERAGYAAVEFSGAADVYLINTCTVTGTGDSKSMKLIRRVHRERPESDIIVAGCLAQRDAEKVLLEGVRLVIGVQKRQQVVQLYEQAVAEGQSINAVEALKNIPFEQLFVSRHEGRTRATMKIQEGCDRYCAYCIIPSVRGPVRSMPVCEVRREAERLAEAGYRELVVTGIHLGSYGRGTEETLIDAIRAVHDAPGVRRVRIGSIEPVTVTEEFAREIANMPGVCRQFHLSMQSGSAGVLKRMRRRYAPEEYMAAVERIRAVMPDAAITTDVIAGFPGETRAEHEETLAFVERVGFARIHVFPYSRRSGTIADQMPDQVPEAEKHRRAQEIIELGNRLEENYVQSMEGSVREVLFEREGPNGLCEGYTGEYVRVRAAARAGEIRSVRILRREGALTFGETVD